MMTPRPTLHFTAPQGWLNDPHGICWVDGEYHLFYQHIPTKKHWSPEIQWGHSVAPNLVQWRHRPVALTPHEGEKGCWSGTTVIEDGRPTIFYTSVTAEDLGRGRIALAFPDAELEHWRSSMDGIVIDGPPAELGAYAFRDPCIFATQDGWTMVVGVGVAGGTGLAVQFKSADARSWTYDGVICSRPGSETERVWTGGLWECPQLFQVGDDWALVVSVWENDVLYYVAGAIGSYDGHTFVPERWSRLTHDETAYAMTSFTDNAGRPCVMFWLREETDFDESTRSWAGALSLPMLAEVGADRALQLRPHPDVDALRVTPAVIDGSLTEDFRLPSGADALDVELSVAAGQRWELSLTDTMGQLLSITVAGDATSVVLARRGRPDAQVPVTAAVIRIILDAGLVELFAGDGSAAFRLPTAGDTALTVAGSPAGQLTVHRLAAAV